MTEEKAKLAEEKILTLKGVYDKDTKRMHRFIIGSYEDDISGGLYIRKGVDIPDSIVIELRVGKTTLRAIREKADEEEAK